MRHWNRAALLAADLPAGADVVLEWNEVALDTLRADRARRGPTQAARSMAIVQIAVFDTVNAVHRNFESIIADVKAGRRTRLDAAVASAAHDTLLDLYPQQKPALDAALAETLERVPNGSGERKAVKLGRRVAKIVLAARADDGGNVIDNDTFVFIDPTTNNAPTIDHVSFPAEITPGKWRPDPLNPTQNYLGVHAGELLPFAIAGGDQFRPPPPPALDSPEYAASYNEVKLLGAKDSAARTAEQTEIGIFWAYDRIYTGTPVALYNQIATTLGVQQGNTPQENARLLALANIAMADAGICAWDCKRWKTSGGRSPRSAPATSTTTPSPSPTPPGNRSGRPAAAWCSTSPRPFPPTFPATPPSAPRSSASSKHFYGTDDVTFTLTSDELPGVTRTFSSFSQASEENGISRIYLGVHWSFDNSEGQIMGNAVADDVVSKVALPRV